MATITDFDDAANDLAYFEVDGPVSAEDIIAVAKERACFSRTNHLVDMTNASFHLLDVPSLRAITEAFAELERVKGEGRTAIVISSDIDGAIAKVFATFSERNASSRISYKVTSSRSEALEWLLASDSR